MRSVDLAVVGAGAAGLMAAIQAGREARRKGMAVSVAALDGARRPGAKILVSGGGRCNVTHDVVDERAFAGSSAKAIRKVLLRFGVDRTTAFFADLGVDLKREETGKLFPVSDSARTVLDALLAAAEAAGVELLHPWRVESITADGDGFLLRRRPEAGRVSEPGQAPGFLRARRVVLATGGRSLPKSGSDGQGFALATALGHGLTPRLLPGLVPLTLPPGHPLTALAGLSAPAEVRVLAGGGSVCTGSPAPCSAPTSGSPVPRSWTPAGTSSTPAPTMPEPGSS